MEKNINSILTKVNKDRLLAKKLIEKRNELLFDGLSKEEYETKFNLLERKISELACSSGTILGKYFYANIEDIIDCLAKEWKVPKNTIEVDYESRLDSKDVSSTLAYYAEHGFNYMKDTSKDAIPFTFKFVSEFKGDKKESSASFYLPLDFVQKDGRTTGMHLNAQMGLDYTFFGNAPYDVKANYRLYIDKLSDFVLATYIGCLVEEAEDLQYIPRDELSIAVLRANEKYRKNATYNSQETEEK